MSVAGAGHRTGLHRNEHEVRRGSRGHPTTTLSHESGTA